MEISWTLNPEMLGSIPTSPAMQYQCNKTGEFITPQYGWTHCPFCGVELKPRKYLIPEHHEVFNFPSHKDDPIVPN